MTGSDSPQDRRAPGWMKILLVVSLALNLLVAGVFLGAVLRHDRDQKMGHDRTEFSRDLSRTPFVAALDPGDRRDLARRLARSEGTLKENRAEIRDRFERLLAALRAEPFERAEVEELLEEQRKAGARRLKIGEDAILDRLAEMSPDARRAYADRLDRSLNRRD